MQPRLPHFRHGRFPGLLLQIRRRENDFYGRRAEPPTCVVPRYQSTGRRQSFYFRPIRNNRRSPGWAAAIIDYLLNLRCAPQHLRRIRSVDANTDFSAGSCNGVTGTERVGTNGLGAVRKSTPRRSESRESDRRDGCRRSRPPLRSHDRNKYVRRPNAAYFHGSCR